MTTEEVEEMGGQLDDDVYDERGRRRRRSTSSIDLGPPRQRMRLNQAESQDPNTQVVRRDGTPPPSFSPVGEGALMAEGPHELLTRRYLREEIRPIREALVALRQDINALAEELRGFYSLLSLFFPHLSNQFLSNHTTTIQEGQ
jgi:hypothetical protein